MSQIRIGVLAALFSAFALAAAASPSCRGSWNVVGACYGVHGRLTLTASEPAAGQAPQVRIRSLEDARVVGVLDIRYASGGDNVLPAKLAQLMQSDPLHTEVEGDFVLCPLDRDTQRLTMRLVCIEAAFVLTK